MTALSATERVDWLRLIRSDGIGPITFRRLMERYGSAAAAIEGAPDIARRAGGGLKISSRAAAEDELAHAERLGADAIAACEAEYPTLLRAIPDAPPILYRIGDANILRRPAIAIVGSRNASLAGHKMAARLSGDLGAAGFVIVSGLARGIDGAAHEAALPTGTIAVVAGGVDVIYPPEHADLTRAIADGGVILSERPPGAAPAARDFPRRNRLISGLSQAVVVVEATARSGTLITARQALDQGREVFAMPGSPLDPRAEGANRLIKQGAGVVTCADDLIEALTAAPTRLGEPSTPSYGQAGPKSDGGLDGPSAVTDDIAADSAVATTEPPAGEPASVKSALRELLGATPVSKDDLIRAVGAPTPAVLDALCELTIEGEAAERDGGGFVRTF